MLVSGEVKFICIFMEDNRLTCMASAYVQQFYRFRSNFYMMRINIFCTCCRGYGGYSVKLLCTMIVVFSPEIVVKKCNSVEFNGWNLSKL